MRDCSDRLHGARVKLQAADAGSAWAACGARLRGAPAAVLGALLEAAIGGDADATGALCALVEAEPPLPPSDAVAPYHTLVALAVGWCTPA